MMMISGKIIMETYVCLVKMKTYTYFKVQGMWENTHEQKFQIKLKRAVFG